MTYFLDTNTVINCLGEEWIGDYFVISSVTLEELENIKDNVRKDPEVKFKARKAMNFLKDHADRYSTVVYSDDVYDLLSSYNLPETPDNKICACCKAYLKNHDVVFVTDDVNCLVIANQIFGIKAITPPCSENEYKGFKEEIMSDEKMAYFYEHMAENQFDSIENEYLVIKNIDKQVVDILKWKNSQYQTVGKKSSYTSKFFGTVKPLNSDPYQQCVIDSMMSNQLTMIKGAAGTGKSYLALTYLSYLLDKGKIDKIIVFCNTVATANSARLGFYPGSKDEKLMDSAIGNMLGSKFGDSYMVDRLVDENRLVLLPMSDIRGYDTSGMKAGVYITEAQNMDIPLMKLALQRIGEDSIAIIDGDYNAQVDLASYGGRNNGMRRMSEVFRGQSFYGEIELQNIYRSKIASIAQNM
jgi:PhoH-like ATPase